MTEETFQALLANVSIGVASLAMGLWVVLGLFWAVNTKGLLRVTLVWLAFNTAGTLGFRLASQISNYNNDDFPVIDAFRLFFNLSVLLLGVFLARYGKRITIAQGEKQLP